MLLLCNRPLVTEIDFDTARFVVSRSCGVDVGEQHLELGEELPSGGLDVQVLRRIYEPPLRLIETFEHAARDPYLREACARKGVDLAASPAPKAQPSPTPIDYLDTLTRKQLAELCSKHGIASDGTKSQLRDRLASVL